MLNNQSLARFFDRSILILQMAILAGVPLYFNRLTNSLFEINKLTLLRVCTLLIGVLWVTRRLLLAKQLAGPDDKLKSQRKTKTLLPVTAAEAVTQAPVFDLRAWKHWPLWLWILWLWLTANVLSTVFSVNRAMAFWGAYDRWDGLLTTMNYAVLLVIFAFGVTRFRQLKYLWGALIASALLAALYGIAQQMGFDFINWKGGIKTDKIISTAGTTGHYCAYAAMMIPVLCAALLAMAEEHQTRWREVFWETLCFAGIIGLYALGVFISAGQLIWVAALLVLAAAFFLGRRSGWQGSLFCTATLVYITFIGSYSRSAGLGFTAGMIFFFVLAGKNYGDQARFGAFVGDMLATLLTVGLVFVTYLFGAYRLHSWVGPVAGLWMLAYGLGLIWIYRNPKIALVRMLILIGFVELHQLTLSMWHLLACVVTGSILFWVLSKRHLTHNVWLWLVLLYFMLVATSTGFALPQWWQNFQQHQHASADLSNKKDESNLASKLEGMALDQAKGSARGSIWQSALAAWLDGPKQFLIGTGPDTVVYVFPQYRRPEYGALEGSHSSTPDKVHNDYLNTLMTRGLLGFVFFYGMLLPCFVLIVVGALLRQHAQSSTRFILAACLSGALVYLGQTLFNFGVAMSYVPFYAFMGLGLATAAYAQTWKDEEPRANLRAFFDWGRVSPQQRLGLCATGLLGMGLLWLALKPFVADMHYRQGTRAFENEVLANGNLSAVERAIQHLSQAVALSPDEPVYRARLGKAYEEWQAQVSDARQKQGLLGLAFENYQNCVAQQPRNPWYLNRLAAVYQLKSSAATQPADQQKFLAEAERLIDQAVAADPNNLIFLENAGFFKQEHKQWLQALAYYDRAVAVAPLHRDAWLRKAQVHEQLGQAQLAAETRQHVLQVVNDYMAAASKKMSQGKVYDAVWLLDYASRFDPDRMDVHLYLAQLYLQTDKFVVAERHLQDILQRYPDDASAIELLKQVHAKKNRNPIIF